MRVGVVAEGRSEFVMVEALVATLDRSAVVQRIWPDFQMGGRPFGWRGVKAWCIEYATQIEPFLRGVKGQEIDLLVVHLDGSMSQHEGARRACPPARDTADALRALIATWLSRSPPPLWLVPMTPMQSTDAWVVAALAPPYNPKSCLGCATAGAGCSHPLECDHDSEAELVRRKLLRRKNNEVKKPEAVYRKLAIDAVAAWAAVASRCTEAERFERELRVAMTAAATPNFWP